MNTILANGTKVQLNFIDHNGLNGRAPEHSPNEEDVGLIGTIIGNTVEHSDIETLQFLGREENVEAGMPTFDDELVIYTVEFKARGNLRLASYEIEVV